MNRTGVFTPNVLLEPALIRYLNMESVESHRFHGILILNILKSLETPERKSLSRLK
jgi:hypothetical protein